MQVDTYNTIVIFLFPLVFIGFILSIKFIVEFFESSFGEERGGCIVLLLWLSLIIWGVFSSG
jgi:hypothetical protein